MTREIVVRMPHPKKAERVTGIVVGYVATEQSTYVVALVDDRLIEAKLQDVVVWSVDGEVIA